MVRNSPAALGHASLRSSSVKIEEEIASDWELSKERTDRTEVKESDPGSPDSLHLRDGLSLPFLGGG